MSFRIGAIVLCALTGALQGADPAAARWEGTVEIPGKPLHMIVDLAQSPDNKWTGSVIVMGYGVKGAPAVDLTVKGSDIAFALKGVLGGAKLSGHLTPAGVFAGDFQQGGNIAPFQLNKVGPPQVEPLRLSTSIGKELEGDWQGEMTFMGNKIQVKLKLANQPTGGGSGQLTLTGRHVNVLPVDLVTQNGRLLSLELYEPGMSYDGQLQKQSNEISGEFTLGGTEIPLSLRPASPAPAVSNQ